MKPWTAFEHLIWKNLQNCGLAQQNRFLLCVSGGVDSIVLLHVLSQIKPNAELQVVHYHHGPTPQPEQMLYRDLCESLIRNLGLKNPTFKMSLSKSLISLKSEDELRKARWQFIESCQQSENEIIVTAHHLDDRLETLLIKLIRGTSADGLLAFQMWNRKIWRPFLNVSKQTIYEYAMQNKLEWIEDPSNLDTDYLRNWLRQDWLPQLENRHQGAIQNMALSLDRLLESSQNSTFEQDILRHYDQGAVDRLWFLLLSKNEQLRALAFLLRWSGVSDFSTGQLEEIRKRLDKNQKDLTFEILDRKWVINATQIVIG